MTYWIALLEACTDAKCDMATSKAQNNNKTYAGNQGCKTGKFHWYFGNEG
jgi:hypothetical protein